MRVRAFATAVLVWLAATSAVASADAIFPPGSGVGLEPPRGMTVAQGFAGFQKGAASIVIVEMPPQAFAQINGDRQRVGATFRVTDTADFTTDKGVAGFVLRGRQAAYGKIFRKWAVVLGSSGETVLVSAQVPLTDSDIDDASIEAALKTVTFRDRPDLAAQIAALPFTVGDLAGFRPVFSLLGLALTEGPKDVDPDGVQPHLSIATSLGAPSPDSDRLAFARAMFSSLKSIRITSITSAKIFEVAGAQWADVEGPGIEGKAAVPHDVTLFVRFGDEDYIVIVASALSTENGRFADRFRRLALSVRPKN
jgi:hypothetical protein